MTRYVVAGVDGSETSLAAARWAAQEAARRKAALRLITVVPRQPARPHAVAGGERIEPWVEQRVESAAGDIGRGHPELDLVIRDIAGEPAGVLDDVGHGAGLLVLGTRGTGGFDGLRLGSVALAVAGSATCPVALIAGAHAARAPGREVVIGIDARHLDERALEVAFEAAQLRAVRLRAVHAWRLPTPYGLLLPAPEEDRAQWEDLEVRLLDDALRPWRGKYPEVTVVPDVRLHNPADALVRASAGVDLLVVGRGPRAAPYLGGVAHALAHHSRCPLLLAPRY